MLIAHLADIHLGKQQYRLEYRERDVYELFLEAIQYCIKEHVDMVLITGDLFDEPRPRINALKTAIDGLRNLVSHGIKVVITPGDHDVPKRRDRLIIDIIPDIISGVYSLGYIRGETPLVKKVFTKDKLALYALPFIPHKSIARKLLPRFIGESKKFFEDHKDYKKILLAHYSLKEVLPFDAILSITQIPSIDYAAFGHIHDRVKQYIPGGGVLAYPGSIDIFSIDEAVSWRERGKGFNIVDLSSTITVNSVHWINLDVRPQYVIDVNTGDIEKLDKMISETIKSPSKKPVIIHVKARIPEHVVNTLRTRVERISSTYKDLVYVRLYLETIEEQHSSIRENSIVVQQGLNEADIIASLIKSPREIAEYIVELAEKLSTGDYDKDHVVNMLKEMYNSWFKNIESPSRHKTTTLTTSSTTRSYEQERDKQRKRSLLDYIN